ncbi:MAG: peptide deformylase [Solirubrobacteraceae bacterium]|nr:peptide deformylase [Solirubrobacteraceae bacterium]
MATERQITPQAIEARRAALRQIRQWGDPALRAVARPVERVDADLVTEARRLISIMDAAWGWGLAATQVGVLRRYFVYREGERGDGAATAIVDPEIAWASDERDSDLEGCLSLSGVVVTVERPVAVRMTGLDLSGRPVTIEAEGPLARRLQHEADHLDGVLMIDRTTKDERKAALRALRDGVAMERPDPDAAATD